MDTLKKVQRSGSMLIMFLFLGLTAGGPLMGQNLSKFEPNPKLTWADKRIRSLIDKEFHIDKTTFRNTTPVSTFPYWIKGLKRYQAMGEGWGAADPPGPPETYIVTPSGKIFLSAAEALTSIRYVPKDTHDALKTGVIIVYNSLPPGGGVIIDETVKPEGIPEDILSGYAAIPTARKVTSGYGGTVFSYASKKEQNKFIRGYHALWKHVITIDGYTYKESITILWEKRG